MLSEKLQALTEGNFKLRHDRWIKKKFCSEVNSAVHGHKWRNLPLVYFNQRNNNNNNNKFHGEIEKSRLQSIPYLLIFFCYFIFLQNDSSIWCFKQKRLWFRGWKRFIPKYKCITLLAKKLRVGEKKSQFSRQETNYNAHVPISSLSVL